MEQSRFRMIWGWAVEKAARQAVTGPSGPHRPTESLAPTPPA